MSEPELRFCHIRHPNNMGVVTVAYFYRPEEKTIIAGFSFCSPFDQFERSFGRMIAMNRLDKRAVLIGDIIMAENGKLDVVSTFTNYIVACLNAKEDIAKKLGVKRYKESDTPSNKENFRWWLYKLATRKASYAADVEKSA
jgi:hypothetical protein